MITSTSWCTSVDTLLKCHFVLITSLSWLSAPAIEFEVVMRTEPGDRLTDNVDHSRLIDIVSKVKLEPETKINQMQLYVELSSIFFTHLVKLV